MSFGTIQGVDNRPIIDNQKENIKQLIDSIERLNVSINKLDTSTTFYSKRMLYLSILMFILVVAQTFVTIMVSNANVREQIIAIVCFVAILLYAFWIISKDLKRNT